MHRKEFVAHEIEELQKVLDISEIAEDVYNQFPEDEEAIRNVRKARAARMIYVHKAFVNIMGAYSEEADFALIDLMERHFECDGEDEQVDREVEAYFGKLEHNRRKKIIYKRRESDETTDNSN